MVREGDRLCTIQNPFDRTLAEVEAPVTGVLVGRLENPVVSPGSPIGHIAAVTDAVLRIFEAKD